MQDDAVRQKEGLRKALVDIALGEVGTREETNNAGSRIVEYQKATWLDPAPWPWCAGWTAWILREWLKLPEARALFNLVDDKAVERWRCRDASAYGWETWAKKHNLQVLPKETQELPGDIVIFTFSHIGLIVQPFNAADPDHIKSCEGNTQPSKDTVMIRNGKRGDGVWLKTRDRNAVHCFIRIIQ